MCSFVNEVSSVNLNTSNDRLRNHKAGHGPVPNNKCIITNIRSHSLESTGVFSPNFKSRFITLINPYSSANVINSYTLQQVDHKSLSLLDALCKRGSHEPFTVLLVLRSKRQRTGYTRRQAQVVHITHFVNAVRITFQLNDFSDDFAKLRKVTITNLVRGRLSVRPSVRPHETLEGFFHEIWCSSIFRKFVDNMKVSLQSYKNKGYFT